ncbi:unnamed protein product [Cyprideis torosa]|uniref:Uncharacterized protein n=1 Tax=Cyprideis torosa TaxID=163714 RepID=A0A7R8ZMZ0_9CRUS|nr:unnamed protein product [Cyprideis torosa]CAG0886682.1 unnamed protein product [Cyprideis torosa]
MDLWSPKLLVFCSISLHRADHVFFSGLPVRDDPEDLLAVEAENLEYGTRLPSSRVARDLHRRKSSGIYDSREWPTLRTHDEESDEGLERFLSGGRRTGVDTSPTNRRLRSLTTSGRFVTDFKDLENRTHLRINQTTRSTGRHLRWTFTVNQIPQMVPQPSSESPPTPAEDRNSSRHLNLADFNPPLNQDYSLHQRHNRLYSQEFNQTLSNLDNLDSNAILNNNTCIHQTSDLNQNFNKRRLNNLGLNNQDFNNLINNWTTRLLINSPGHQSLPETFNHLRHNQLPMTLGPNLISNSLAFKHLLDNLNSSHPFSSPDSSHLLNNLDFSHLLNNLDFSHLPNNLDFSHLLNNLDFSHLPNNLDFSHLLNNLDFSHLLSNNRDSSTLEVNNLRIQRRLKKLTSGGHRKTECRCHLRDQVKLHESPSNPRHLGLRSRLLSRSTIRSGNLLLVTGPQIPKRRLWKCNVHRKDSATRSKEVNRTCLIRRCTEFRPVRTEMFQKLLMKAEISPNIHRTQNYKSLLINDVNNSLQPLETLRILSNLRHPSVNRRLGMVFHTANRINH